MTARCISADIRLCSCIWPKEAIGRAPGDAVAFAGDGCEARLVDDASLTCPVADRSGLLQPACRDADPGTADAQHHRQELAGHRVGIARSWAISSQRSRRCSMGGRPLQAAVLTARETPGRSAAAAGAGPDQPPSPRAACPPPCPRQRPDAARDHRHPGHAIMVDQRDVGAGAILQRRQPGKPAAFGKVDRLHRLFRHLHDLADLQLDRDQPRPQADQTVRRQGCQQAVPDLATRASAAGWRDPDKGRWPG